MLQSYRDLKVWQKAMEVVTAVYAITNRLPKEEIYGLTSQMRRSAVSIPSNIAEGYARRYRQEYAQFIKIAFGSGAELETQIEISKRLLYIPAQEALKVEGMLTEVMKMLNGLSSALSTKP